jgi:hypothetical protein
VRALLWREHDTLLGFLGIYGSGWPALELTGMVDPQSAGAASAGRYCRQRCRSAALAAASGCCWSFRACRSQGATWP